MNRSIATALILLSTLLNACEMQKNIDLSDQLFDTKSILEKKFSSDLASSSNNGNFILSYCPDNTCDVFEFNDTGNKIQIYDFVYLYFYYISDYNYPVISDFREEQNKSTVDIVLERNSSNCSINEIRTKCILSSLSKKSGLTLKFVRYDEGRRNEVIQNIEQVLNKLRRT